MKTLRLLSVLIAAAFAAPAAEYLMYVGTYTGPHSQGIYVYRFDAATGKATSLGLAGEARNPSFLAVHPSGNYLYSVDESDGGAVSAFRIDHKTGKLARLNMVSSRGSGPCALTVDATGRNLLVANYGSGSVALIPIKGDGSLAGGAASDQHTGSSVNKERQEGPHAHSADFAPGNRFALSADLGLDDVFVYRFDAQKNTLVPNAPPFGKVRPGYGPRHVAFHPNGKFAYVVNELNSTVTSFAWDGRAGTLKEISTVSALPKGSKVATDGAEIHVHPNGKFVYSSNRSEANNIALFRADAATGKLEFVEVVPSGGRSPRYFGLDPTGAWLASANEESSNILLFRVDPNTGKLTPSGKPIEIYKPVCVKFVAAK